MSAPLVTIAMPFMNPGRFFELSLKSIFSQTFTDWELILIDDGSSDDSPAIAQKISDPRVRYFSDGQNRKLNERLNQAIKLARGKLLVRMDADDIMAENRIEKQVAHLERSSEDTVLGTAAYSIDTDSSVVGIRHVPKRQTLGFAARMSFIHPTVAGYTSWFRKHLYSGHFIFHRSQDAELWSRTSAVSTFTWLDEPLLFYREQGAFSARNYFATQMGMLAIALDSKSSRLYKSVRIFQESMKLAITTTAAVMGLEHWIIRARYSKLSAEQKQRAEAMILRIQNLDLPTSDTSDKRDHSLCEK